MGKKHRKPILSLDFDGVLHSYSSGWQGADTIPDPPVAGAMQFLAEAVQHFDVHIFSTRSHQDGGLEAMADYLSRHLDAELGTDAAAPVFCALTFATHKPPASVALDDRVLTFHGYWPPIEHLVGFKPWSRRSEIEELRYQLRATLAAAKAGLASARRALAAPGVKQVSDWRDFEEILQGVVPALAMSAAAADEFERELNAGKAREQAAQGGSSTPVGHHSG